MAWGRESFELPGVAAADRRWCNDIRYRGDTVSFEHYGNMLNIMKAVQMKIWEFIFLFILAAFIFWIGLEYIRRKKLKKKQ